MKHFFWKTRDVVARGKGLVAFFFFTFFNSFGETKKKLLRFSFLTRSRDEPHRPFFVIEGRLADGISLNKKGQQESRRSEAAARLVRKVCPNSFIDLQTPLAFPLPPFVSPLSPLCLGNMGKRTSLTPLICTKKQQMTKKQGPFHVDAAVDVEVVDDDDLCLAHRTRRRRRRNRGARRARPPGQARRACGAPSSAFADLAADGMADLRTGE